MLIINSKEIVNNETTKALEKKIYLMISFDLKKIKKGIKKIKLKTKKAFSVVVYEIKIIIIDKFALNFISFILSFNVE
tara:strand:- start:228 stop:461 length:234 start_codon:yes stop_codon:yes gene_type:complete